LSGAGARYGADPEHQDSLGQTSKDRFQDIVVISQQAHADDLKTQSNVNAKGIEIDSPTTIARNDQGPNSGFPLSRNSGEVAQKRSSVGGANPALRGNRTSIGSESRMASKSSFRR